MPKSAKTLVMIATYNEADNIEPICQALLALNRPFGILFVDDNSPDGSGKIINGLCEKFSNVFALHRNQKMGVGSAHQDGIRWAYDHGYGSLLTMDCDFTHSPDKVVDFLDARKEADVVVGSRYKSPDSIEDWRWYRKILTHLAHALVVLFLGMPFDASGAFRAYNLKRIPREAFTLVQDPGYAFFWESLFVLWINHFTVKEIPIDLPNRTYGTSKMQLRDIFKSFSHLMVIFWRKVCRRDTLILPHK